jgi:hypothetical protein
MPRAATTTDVFNAMAEPRQRQIIEVLARRGALPVGSRVATLGVPAGVAEGEGPKAEG